MHSTPKHHLGSSEATSNGYSGLGKSEGRSQSRLGRGSFTILGSSWRRSLLRVLWMGCSFGVMLYSVAVLTHVAWMGTIGVRCMFGTKVEEEIPADYVWQNSRPRKGDSLLSIGAFEIRDGSYSDYIRTLRGLSAAGRRHDRSAVARSATRRGPFGTGYRSVSAVMDLLSVVRLVPPGDADLRHRGEGVLEAAGRRLGAAVLLALHRHGRRVHGGYHWTEIVAEPLLIYLFAVFAVFVPVVNLHFYLVFPRANPIFARHRRWVLGALYGVPTAYLLALWGSMYAVRWSGDPRTTTCRRPPRSSSSAAWRWATSRLAVVLFGALHPLPGLQLPQRADAGRAEPGPVDPAGLADLARC